MTHPQPASCCSRLVHGHGLQGLSALLSQATVTPRDHHKRQNLSKRNPRAAPMTKEALDEHTIHFSWSSFGVPWMPNAYCCTEPWMRATHGNKRPENPWQQNIARVLSAGWSVPLPGYWGLPTRVIVTRSHTVGKLCRWIGEALRNTRSGRCPTSQKWGLPPHQHAQGCQLAATSSHRWVTCRKSPRKILVREEPVVQVPSKDVRYLL